MIKLADAIPLDESVIVVATVAAIERRDDNHVHRKFLYTYTQQESVGQCGHFCR